MAKKDKVGAVLVVGGGIGGIQSALDLAESGFRVYLVDNSPAIGGVMAQLDKTFPTLDCSMCILSPKMVEAGRHLNIELLTYCEVLGIEGEPGDFNVSIRKKARFVDAAKCTGCGLCAEGCPISMPSEFDEGFGERKAIYTPFLQAVPNTYVIDKREERPCKSACKDACPVHMNVLGYIKLIAEGKFQEAYKLIRDTNPFPAICGRVCYAPCEEACNRDQIDEPIAIRDLKRFVADQVDIHELEVPTITKTDKKVAIVGAGPAGLAAANDLALKGHQVTIFETLPEPGGMLRVGIPEYRLPKEILHNEIGYIQKLGVEIRTGIQVGKDITLEEIGKSYDAVFIGTGAHGGMRLRVEGEDLPGVMEGIRFLRVSNLGEKVEVGRKTAVIGGGNTAVDCARMAKRLGAKEVTIVYRRSRAEMPASAEEVASVEEEGIPIGFLTTPTRFLAENGRLAKMECIRMKLGEPDASGRPRPIPIEGSEFTTSVDTVIAALGQVPETEFVKELGISLSRRSTIEIDPKTGVTNIEGVFSGGDVVTGPAFVIDAIAAGKLAARSIDRYLKGESLEVEEEEKEPEKLSKEEVEDLKRRFPSKKRVKMKEEPTAERIKDFREVALGYTHREAMEEASRCLAGQIEGCFECHECEGRCEPEAISYDMQDELIDLRVGAVILAPGFDEFDASIKGEYGYGIFPNVVTSIQLERILCASGPFQGHFQRPSDGREPKSIGFIQCVGSRDIASGNDYCSSVCCTYAIKEAIIVKEHSEEIKPTIFYMDMRTYGKGFEEFYNRAKDEYGVRFIRARVSCIEEVSQTKDLRILYETEEGELLQEDFDLVVLSVGLASSISAKELAERLGVELDEHGFCKTSSLAPVETSKTGIFVAGAFASPKDIPETVMQASGAASFASGLLSDVRGTLVEAKEYPPEIDVAGQEPRIGAFICHCGINIGGYVDVPQVVEYAKTLPGVVYAEGNLYTCSQDTQKIIKERIKEHNLNRVIVASCTPRTHGPLFQETIREAGLNRYLFEMANIRDQCSWVHMHEPEAATQKAKDLVRMAVAKARILEPLERLLLPITHKGLVIGGGLAGMTAALRLAEEGFDVCLVEKEKELGGNLRKIYSTLEGHDVQDYLKTLIEKVKGNPRIEVITNTQVVDFSGYAGNFTTGLLVGPGMYAREIKHGVTIVATGANEIKPKEYLYDQDPRVITQLELEERLAEVRSQKSEVRGQKKEGLSSDVCRLSSVVMIQCVGSREAERPYCSRICCSQAIKNALKIREINPKASMFVLYRDMRTYGFMEEYYARAREEGIVFVRYDQENKPQVSNEDGTLKVSIVDPILGERLVLEPDLLVLASAIAPPPENSDLAKILKVTLTQDAFFLEAHVKLRPVDFATNGIYLCGLAHGPKLIPETISQACAAASRACTLLSKLELEVGGVVAHVDEDKCTACLTCVRVCPYEVPEISADGVAEIEPAKCQGCGICAAECPAKAIELQHYKDLQIVRKLEALFEEIPV